MKSFSIIVPYYNSNDYIKKCILSIINSNYDSNKIEIIVIDDGSNNDTYENINLLMKKYNNIKFYKKSNGQWGSVVNYVKKNKLINNEYVSILDSDDFYDINCFSIINNLKDSDMLCGSFQLFNGKKNKMKIVSYFHSSRKEIINKDKMKTYFCLPFPFFVKKELFYKIDDLLENIPYQDGSLLSRYIQLANTFSFTKKVVGYYYFNRPQNSTSMEWNQKRIDYIKNTCNEYLKYDNQECIFYRILFNKELRKIFKNENIKFKVNRKFNFNYWPFFMRIFIKTIFLLYKGFFIKNHN